MAKAKTKHASDELFSQAEVIEQRPPEPKLPATRTPQRQEVARVVSTTPADVMAIIERLAIDDRVDPDKLDRLISLQERVMDRTAKMAFDRAMSEMQPRLPVIARRGTIEIREKDRTTQQRTGAIVQKTKFAKWEDINDEIQPVLKRYGFAITFRTGAAADGKILVTAILSHKDGHREETMLSLVHDTTGSKNPVQAVGSTISYGKRYCACALLNITTREEDDDGLLGGGKPAVVGEPMSAEDLDKLNDFVEAAEVNRDGLIDYLNRRAPPGHPELTKLADLPQSRFQEAVDAINGYASSRKEREADASKGNQR